MTKINVEIPKPLHEAISEYVKTFPYYEGVEDFILEATRRHMEHLYPILQHNKLTKVKTA